MYHRIADEPVDPWGMCVSAEHFAEHMQVLARSGMACATGELARELADGDKPAAAVAVTFDDGYADNLHTGLPILERFAVPATFFVVASAIGRHAGFWWDELERLLLHDGPLPAKLDLTIDDRSRCWRLDDEPLATVGDASRARRAWRAWDAPRSDRERAFAELWAWLRDQPAAPRDLAIATLRSQLEAAGCAHAEAPRALTADELVSLAGHELAEIGAHTSTHQRLCRLTVQERRDEIAAGKTALEQAVGHRLAGFAYPFGEWDAETVHLVREANFDYACGAGGCALTRRSSPFVVPRVQIEDCDGDAFAERLSRLLPSGTL